jgi:ABC-2 type transport system permease protein
MLLRQVRFEARLLLRNGEQLLLTIVIPVVLLVVLGGSDMVDVTAGGADADRLGTVVAGVLAVAVLSTAFTSLAISTGFERRAGSLRRLGATPLPRWGLLAGKVGALLLVELVQVVVLLGVAGMLGWRPPGPTALLGAAALALLATLSLGAIGFAVAGLLSAEVTLAVANLVHVMLLVLGGIVVPVSLAPAAVQPFLLALPSAALGEGMRALLAGGPGALPLSVVVLVVWGAAASVLAARTFRWS